MSDFKNVISVSYLTTREDYCNFKLAACHAALKQKEVIAIKIIGFCLVLFGFAGRVLLAGDFYRNSVYTFMVLVGVVFGFYFDSIQPYSIKRRAVLYFENNIEKMVSQTFVFENSSISIRSNRYEMTLPYENFYGFYEDQHGFLLYVGIGEIHYLPKRALTEDDCQNIHDLLARRLQLNLNQEGVR